MYWRCIFGKGMKLGLLDLGSIVIEMVPLKSSLVHVYWIRNIIYLYFDALPCRLPGYNDYGGESTWLLFASLGFYPHASRYILGSPTTQSTKIDLKGKDGITRFVTLETVNNDHRDVYAEKLLINGQEHRSSFIDRSIFTQEGGVILSFYMSTNPNSGLCP